VVDDMERIAYELRRECTVGVTYEELSQAMDVMTRLKENLQALDTTEAPPPPESEEGK
jgi:MarR family transcriptional regulator, transcriptional regulator for hemolysin